jgi:hypothetical protein
MLQEFQDSDHRQGETPLQSQSARANSCELFAKLVSCIVPNRRKQSYKETDGYRQGTHPSTDPYRRAAKTLHEPVPKEALREMWEPTAIVALHRRSRIREDLPLAQVKPYSKVRAVRANYKFKENQIKPVKRKQNKQGHWNCEAVGQQATNVGLDERS